jgi:aspartate racemase
VLITHRGVVNHSLAVSRHFALHAHDRIAQCASLNFDISVEEIFPSWISGAAVILCPSSVFFPGTDLARWTTQEEITVLNLPTAFWHEWVNELERSQETLSFPLRLVVVGGEKVSAQAFTKWKHIAGTTVRWVNTYGPTEGTVTTTFYEPPSDVEAREILTEIPIGRPISNSQVYVLDRYLQPVPLGVPGELYIWGYGVARGYLNQPELTAEKFIAHPFSTNPGARLYKTGDVVRYRPDDNLEFIGRTDHQVKIRGFRIELGEIESALSQHPSVREGVVLAREDVLGDKRLVAYIVSNQQPGLSTDNLRSFLKQKLPEYMRPTAFVFLDSLPLTPNGKVDHRALPAPDQARPELVVTFVAPRTPVEELLAGIWVAVLKVENVGVHDNFFELGGHSLLATQVISRVHDTFGLNLPVRTLFENPTIDGFANMIQTGKAGSSNNPVTAITPLSRQLYSVKQSP